MNTLTEPGKKELRNFGLIMTCFIPLLFGLLIPWVFSATYKSWPWILGGCFLLPAVLYPISLKPVYKLWLKFGHVMGWINTRIILGFMFYCVFTPIGLVMRIFGKDPLTQKFDTNIASYRKQRNVKIKPEDMEKPF